MVDRNAPAPAPPLLGHHDELEANVARETVRAALFRGAERALMLGRYKLIRRLGGGGMGVVLLAHDPRLDRPVAVKVLREGLHAEWAREQLLREARSIARLSHPNVVAVYDADIEQGRVFVAMEYVDGVSLESWVAAPRPWPEVVALLVQAGRGLAAAHAAGIVHRDFKPANVLLGRDGRPRVADFGLAIASGPVASPAVLGTEIASLAETAAALGEVPMGAAATLQHATGLAGTPLYMAPEQLLAGVSGVRSDQYAFCVSAFELLFGRPPFEVTSLVELCKALVERTPELPPTIPASLRKVLSRGLSRVPQDRYPDMTALLDALEEILAREAPRPPVSRASAQPPEARHPRCERYIAGLPAGADSHPHCTMRSSYVRLAMAGRPLDDGAPEAAREALAHPSLQGDRIATARGRILLLAVFDRHFGTDGGSSSAGVPPAAVERWRDLHRGLARSQLHNGLLVLAMSGCLSPAAPQLAERALADCHRGTPLTLERLGQGQARVRVTWPAGLHDDLFAVELEEHLRVAFEIMGARFFELRWSERGHERLDGAMVWR
jgi:serine/threonine protein kinase